MPISELAFYDIGLDNQAIDAPKTSAKSQRVVYEDHRLEPRRAAEAAALAEAVDRAACASTVAESAESRPSVVEDNPMAMESIGKYSGVGGVTTQRVFTQDSSVVYLRMKNTPTEHVLNGFVEMDFIGLLGTRITGGARTVQTSFMEVWNSRNEGNPNIEGAVDAEVRRQLWRD